VHTRHIQLKQVTQREGSADKFIPASARVATDFPSGPKPHGYQLAYLSAILCRCPSRQLTQDLELSKKASLDLLRPSITPPMLLQCLRTQALPHANYLYIQRSSLLSMIALEVYVSSITHTLPSYNGCPVPPAPAVIRARVALASQWIYAYLTPTAYHPIFSSPFLAGRPISLKYSPNPNPKYTSHITPSTCPTTDGAEAMESNGILNVRYGKVRSLKRHLPCL